MGKALNFLIVDDTPMAADLFALMLKLTLPKYGFKDCNFVSATDGAMAIRHLTETIFDVVITDFNMPECNGVEIARFARSNRGKVATLEAPSDMLIGILTALDTKSDREYFSMLIAEGTIDFFLRSPRISIPYLLFWQIF